MYSTYCLPAVEFSEHILNLKTDDSDVHKVKKVLAQWDKRMDKNSVGATLYEVTRYMFVKNLLAPTLGDSLVESFMGTGFEPVLLPSHEFYGHDTTVSLRLLDNKSSQWIRQAGGKEAILTKSIKDALNWLTAELGPIREEWRWGKIHKALFPHAFDINKFLKFIFNPQAIAVDGNTDTPKQTAMMPNNPYDNRAWSISYRMLIDFSISKDSFNVIIAPGQSGLLGHKHYDDLILLWERGDYIRMVLNPSLLSSQAESQISFTHQEENFESER